MKILKIEAYKTSQMLLVLAVIILVIPVLLNLPAIKSFFDFSSSGQIGDTIGGITAPFINGLAAILVFIAFKAQIRANELLKNQEESRNILEQIKAIQDDRLDVDKWILAVKNRVESLTTPADITIMNMLNKIIYFTSEVRLANDLIDEYKGEKNYLYRKLFYLYKIRYKDNLSDLEHSIMEIFNRLHHDYQAYITELLTEIQHLNECFSEIDKYKVVNSD